MWLDIGHHKSYDGTKMSYQKDTEDKDDRSFRTPSKAKARKKYRKSTRRHLKEHEEAKKNSNFTQTYPKGWQRIRELVRDKQGAAAIGLYSFSLNT